MIDTYGTAGAVRVEQWQEMMQYVSPLPLMEQLHQVNHYINDTQREMNDIQLWGQEDYWATVVEFIGAGAGDCEDFAIAKYWALRTLGFDDNDLRLIYAQVDGLGTYHILLAFYPADGGEPLLLDSLSKVIVPASERNDIRPVFSFNIAHIWVNKNRFTAESLRSSEQFSTWQSVLSRQTLKRPLIFIGATS
ncbi:transglutaminase-like cysteine peptidase [Ferrimonas pelagia]|uniref:transglutaminase-like cysteine peptidase n=1 Tax=Ferrimonas pelagia TaxID=1177826 RepID=UPI0031E70F25